MLSAEAIEIAAAAPRPVAPARHLPRHRGQLAWAALFVGPAVFGFLFFKLVPILASFVIALTNWTVANTPSFVGSANFERLLADRLFWKSLGVTAYYAAFSVPASMAFALLLAMLLNQKLPGQRLFRTIFYLPSVMPVIVTSVLWLWMFNPDLGLLNALLADIGLPKAHWIYSEGGAIPSLVFMSIWHVGPMMIIFLAGLQGVPRTLYEAVEIDGGGALARFRHVTLPMLTPTILFNLVISTIGALQTFTQSYVMTDGGPNNASLFMVFYIYRTAFKDTNMGYASALAWVLFVIIAAISFLLLKTSNRWVYYEGGNR
ncbi:MAG TPA: sugar ABC transporter permease [Kaistia sp.]|nr:sugar ABC transporter permease [Kaistia sp.]